MPFFLTFLAFLCLGAGRLVAQASDTTLFRPVGASTFWYEQAENLAATDRPFYVGGIWENVSEDYLAVRMILGAATPAGDLIGRCDVQPDGIAPHEKIWLACKVGDIPPLDSATVSARTEWIKKVSGIMPNRQVESAAIRPGLRTNSETLYEIVARIAGIGDRDRMVMVRFRVYNADNILLNVCENSATVVPEGAVEVTSFGYCGSVPHHIGPITRATVELESQEP